MGILWFVSFQRHFKVWSPNKLHVQIVCYVCLIMYNVCRSFFNQLGRYPLRRKKMMKKVILLGKMRKQTQMNSLNRYENHNHFFKSWSVQKDFEHEF